MLESPLGTVGQQVCGGATRARTGCGRPYPNIKRRAGAVPAHAALGAGRPRRVRQRGRALWRARHPLRGRPGAQGTRVFGQRPAGAPPRSGQARGMLMAWPASTLKRACGRIPVRGSGLLRWGARRRLLVLCFCCSQAVAGIRSCSAASMQARPGRPAGLHPGRQLDRLGLDAALLGAALPRRGPHARRGARPPPRPLAARTQGCRRCLRQVWKVKPAHVTRPSSRNDVTMD